MKRVFLDTEFTGLHKKTTLLSIALITEDGKAFYREMSDYAHDKNITGWIKDNVMPNLTWQSPDPATADAGARNTITMFQLRDQLEEWFETTVGVEEGIEIWTDTGAYDWVLFNSIWGNALNKPDYIHYIPGDIATFFRVLGLDPDTDRWQFADMDPTKPKHNALWDAVAISRCYVILDKIREAQFIPPPSVLDLDDSPPESLMDDNIPTESASDTPQDATKEGGEGSDTGETEKTAPKAKPKPKPKTTAKKTTKKTEGS